jgi:hypothetical protein
VISTTWRLRSVWMVRVGLLKAVHRASPGGGLASSSHWQRATLAAIRGNRGFRGWRERHRSFGRSRIRAGVWRRRRRRRYQWRRRRDRGPACRYHRLMAGVCRRLTFR